MNLQELLKMKVKSQDHQGNEVEISPEFRVAVQSVYSDGSVHIIIHPNGHNGETLDFLVKGNTLHPVFASRPPNPPGAKKGVGPWEKQDPSRQVA